MEDSLQEIQALRDKVAKKKLPISVKEYIDTMLERVARSSKFGNYSYEYEGAARYIYWIASIPWGEYSKDDLELPNAKKVLNEDHYGMDLVKERVLEYLAVMNLKHESDTKTPIICFVGLQGIGKTTMAASIAKALGRSFERVSLGGMPSALELLGRTRANPDAEPGLITKALIRAKTMNPVLLLDELDKTGSDLGSRASVMASLLEILDPEQNETFMDNYIGFPMDLSKVFFVLTANNLGGISTALLDRLEVIKLTGYSDQEKLVIAKEFLLPKMYAATGVSAKQLAFTEDVWPHIIRPLGYEAGIRELERVLMGIGRKVAKKLLEDPKTIITITPDTVKDYTNL
jgi:ATP-dependent Lon protease